MTETATAINVNRITQPGLTDSQVVKFKRVVQEARDGGKFAIVVAQIDPDAIGSAFGMQEILRLLNAEATIYYSGKIGHPQNEALANKYNLLSRMKPMDDLFGDVDGTPTCMFNNIVLVDSNRARDSRLPGTVSPVIVADHHRNSDVEEAINTFVWIDEDGCGSACTMIAELFSKLDYEVKPDLAVMMALGIYTDTKSRNRAGARDEAAYAWCKHYANSSDLVRLILYKRPFSFMRNLSHAVQYIDKYDTYRQGRILAGLGRLAEKQGDDLAMVADELLRTIGAPLIGTWAIIEIKDPKTNEVITRKIRFCARSEELGINLSDKLAERFGNSSGAKIIPDGTGEGGALFELVLPSFWFKDEETDEIVHKRILEWFFDTEVSATETE